MRHILFALLLTASPALAQDATPLTYDIEKLCAWQNTNNGMDIAECTKLEKDAEASVPELEKSAASARKEECIAEAKSYSGDSGFASFTVYAECLKAGPGNL
jgi:hypothetical protein